MRIVYHLGAHCTDEERLLRCLLKNRGVLAQQGILVPGPARYRTLLRDTVISLKGEAASPETQALVLDQILEEGSADRLVLSWDSFLSYPQWALRGGLYAAGAQRVQALARVFPDAEVEFFLAIRNPATFLPALRQRQMDKTTEDVTEGTDPLTLRWSHLVNSIREMNPEVPLTVWCDEDTPLIWPEVLARVSGHAPGTVLEEADDLLASIMSPDGLQRMRGYLATHTPQNELQRRRIVSAFLDKFALPDQIEMDLEMPGWTEDLVATLTGQYEQDVARIAHTPGVRFITP